MRAHTASHHEKSRRRDSSCRGLPSRARQEISSRQSSVSRVSSFFIARPSFVIARPSPSRVCVHPGPEQLRLLCGPGDADDAAPGETRELAHQLAHGAGRRGDEHGLAGLGRADLVEPHVGREPRHAEDARVVGERDAAAAAVVGDLGEERGGGGRTTL